MSFEPSDNVPPLVDAGPDQTITISDTLSLAGTASDDGTPNPPGVITTTWSKFSGPGTVVFGMSNSLNTTATFTSAGTYVLRLTTTDSELSSSDDIAINVQGSAGEFSIERSIFPRDDDAEENRNLGTVSVNNGDLELGFDGGTPQYIGLRFNEIDIPPGATILNAYVQFTTDASIAPANTAILTIRGEATNNATIFSTAPFNISSRPTTTTSVTWQPANWPTAFEAGPNQKTDNIATVIQEIIGRPGWSNGNSLALIITGTGMRRAVSSNENLAQAPVLHITYSNETFNYPPTAQDDSYTTTKNSVLNVAAPGVLGNDTDPTVMRSQQQRFPILTMAKSH